MRNVDVRVIRERLANGERQIDIATDLGVTKQTINDISRGKTYRQVA